MAEEKAFTELFEDQIKDLYSAEKQIVQALPKMARKTTNPQLRAAFEKHLEETRNHVVRLEQIAEELDFTPRGKKCKGAEGLIEEGKEAMESFEDDTLDAALIGAAQRVEHYEIAAYGTAKAHAELLGFAKAVRLLQQTLDEETRTDKKLTQLAESIVNVEALQEA
jgi:ferritin-like metal-binding protein YciE